MCVEKLFAVKTVIKPCPLNHDDCDLDETLTCSEGVYYWHLQLDDRSNNTLSKYSETSQRAEVEVN